MAAAGVTGAGAGAGAGAGGTRSDGAAAQAARTSRGGCTASSLAAAGLLESVLSGPIPLSPISLTTLSTRPWKEASSSVSASTVATINLIDDIHHQYALRGQHLDRLVVRGLACLDQDIVVQRQQLLLVTGREHAAHARRCGAALRGVPDHPALSALAGAAHGVLCLGEQKRRERLRQHQQLRERRRYVGDADVRPAGPALGDAAGGADLGDVREQLPQGRRRTERLEH